MASKKSSIITAVMKHPKLSAELKAALKSPLGSSKRRAAFLKFKTLKAVNKIGSPRIQRFTGRGGPGYYGQGAALPTFSAPQSPAFQTGSMADTTQILQAPTMPVSSNYVFIPDPTKPSAKAVVTPPATPLSTLSPWATTPTSITPTTTTPSTAGAKMPGFTPWDQIKADIDADIAATKKTTAPVAPSLKPPATTPAAAPAAPTVPAVAPAAPIQPAGITPLPAALPGTPEYAAQLAQLQPTEADTTAAAGEPTDILKQAVAAGIGPSAFRYMLMSDTKKLAELTGAPIESLPSGPSLSKIIDDLTATLEKESGLQGQLSELSKRTTTGAGLEKQLTDYVTTRDSYIEDVDGMIKKIKAEALNRDMADPAVQTEVNNNLNYLYTLKSRQVKRYADFVKDSFDIYNNQTTQLTTAYQVAKDNFDAKLASQTAIAKEDFQNWSDMLEEMYKAEKELEDNFYTKANQKLKYDTANGTLAGNALDGYGASYSLKDIPIYNNAVAGQQKELQQPGGTASDKLVITNANIGDTMNYLASQYVGEGATPRTADPRAAIDGLSTEISSNMPYVISLGTEGEDMLKTYTDRLLEYWNQYGNQPDTDVTTKTNVHSNIEVLTEAIANGFNKALYSSLAAGSTTKDGVQSSPKLDAVKEAIEDLLINKKWFGLSQKPRTTDEVTKYSQEWYNKYSKTINPTILRAIAGYFDVQQSMKDPATGKPLGGTPYEFLPRARDPQKPSEYLRVNGMSVNVPPAQLSISDIASMVNTGLFWELYSQGF